MIDRTGFDNVNIVQPEDYLVQSETSIVVHKMSGWIMRSRGDVPSQDPRNRVMIVSLSTGANNDWELRLHVSRIDAMLRAYAAGVKLDFDDDPDDFHDLHGHCAKYEFVDPDHKVARLIDAD